MTIEEVTGPVLQAQSQSQQQSQQQVSPPPPLPQPPPPLPLKDGADADPNPTLADVTSFLSIQEEITPQFLVTNGSGTGNGVAVQQINSNSSNNNGDLVTGEKDTFQQQAAPLDLEYLMMQWTHSDNSGSDDKLPELNLDDDDAIDGSAIIGDDLSWMIVNGEHPPPAGATSSATEVVSTNSLEPSEVAKPTTDPGSLECAQTLVEMPKTAAGGGTSTGGQGTSSPQSATSTTSGVEAGAGSASNIDQKPKRKYKCPICFKEINFHNHKRHELIHAAVKPFTCTFCGRGFIQATSLERHKKAKHSEEEEGGEGDDNTSPSDGGSVDLGASTSIGGVVTNQNGVDNGVLEEHPAGHQNVPTESAVTNLVIPAAGIASSVASPLSNNLRILLMEDPVTKVTRLLLVPASSTMNSNNGAQMQYVLQQQQSTTTKTVPESGTGQGQCVLLFNDQPNQNAPSTSNKPKTADSEAIHQLGQHFPGESLAAIVARGAQHNANNPNLKPVISQFGSSLPMENSVTIPMNSEAHQEEETKTAEAQSNIPAGKYQCEQCGAVICKKGRYKHERRHREKAAKEAEAKSQQQKTQEQQAGSQQTSLLSQYLVAAPNSTLFGTPPPPAKKRRIREEQTCDICEKKLSSKNALKNHLATHSTERPFTCEICFKGFKTKEVKNSHQRKHKDNEQPAAVPAEEPRSEAAAAPTVQHFYVRLDGSASANDLALEPSPSTTYTTDLTTWMQQENLLSSGAGGLATTLESDPMFAQFEPQPQQPLVQSIFPPPGRSRTSAKCRSDASVQTEPFSGGVAQLLQQQSFLSGSAIDELFSVGSTATEVAASSAAAPTSSEPQPDSNGLYSCEICSRTFTQRTSYRRHKIVHSDERNWQCTICSKGFKTKDSLKSHIATHNPNRDHICAKCGMAFRTSTYLRRHQAHTECRNAVASASAPTEAEGTTTASEPPPAEASATSSETIPEDDDVVQQAEESEMILSQEQVVEAEQPMEIEAE